MQFAAPSLVRMKSTRRLGSPSAKVPKSPKYFREDTASTDWDDSLLDMKDVEADFEFEMLALDG